jgi:hypothetical protein
MAMPQPMQPLSSRPSLFSRPLGIDAQHVTAAQSVQRPILSEHENERWHAHARSIMLAIGASARRWILRAIVAAWSSWRSSRTEIFAAHHSHFARWKTLAAFSAWRSAAALEARQARSQVVDWAISASRWACVAAFTQICFISWQHGTSVAHSSRQKDTQHSAIQKAAVFRHNEELQTRLQDADLRAAEHRQQSKEMQRRIDDLTRHAEEMQGQFDEFTRRREESFDRAKNGLKQRAEAAERRAEKLERHLVEKEADNSVDEFTRRRLAAFDQENDACVRRAEESERLANGFRHEAEEAERRARMAESWVRRTERKALDAEHETKGLQQQLEDCRKQLRLEATSQVASQGELISEMQQKSEQQMAHVTTEMSDAQAKKRKNGEPLAS